MSALYSGTRWPSWRLDPADLALHHTGTRHYTVDLLNLTTISARLAAIVQSDRLGQEPAAELAEALADLVGPVEEDDRLGADVIRRRVLAFVAAHAEAGP